MRGFEAKIKPIYTASPEKPHKIETICDLESSERKTELSLNFAKYRVSYLHYFRSSGAYET